MWLYYIHSKLFATAKFAFAQFYFTLYIWIEFLICVLILKEWRICLFRYWWHQIKVIACKVHLFCVVFCGYRTRFVVIQGFIPCRFEININRRDWLFTRKRSFLLFFDRILVSLTCLLHFLFLGVLNAGKSKMQRSSVSIRFIPFHSRLYGVFLILIRWCFFFNFTFVSLFTFDFLCFVFTIFFIFFIKLFLSPVYFKVWCPCVESVCKNVYFLSYITQLVVKVRVFLLPFTFFYDPLKIRAKILVLFCKFPIVYPSL